MTTIDNSADADLPAADATPVSALPTRATEVANIVAYVRALQRANGID
jgi:hypothetical protein